MKELKIVLVSCMICILSACNTMQGVGEDLQQGGQALSKAASNEKGTETQK